MKTPLVKPCKHNWMWIGETRQSENDWCVKCGAWKRLDLDTGKVTVHKTSRKDGQS